MTTDSYWMYNGPMSDQVNLGMLLLRCCLGISLALHGLNKIFGASGLSGTASWFAGIGFRWPSVQARLAATTEIGAGLMLALGLLTPLASAGIIGVMIVAIVVAHWRVGFFVFHTGQGWEYCATIGIAALAVGMIGPGEWSVDNAIGFSPDGWIPMAIAAGVGLGSALVQLGLCYRPGSRGGS